MSYLVKRRILREDGKLGRLEWETSPFPFPIYTFYNDPVFGTKTLILECTPMGGGVDRTEI